MTTFIGADVDATYATLDEGRTPKVGDVYDGPDGKSYKFVQFTEGAVPSVVGNVTGYVSESSTAVTCDSSTTDRIGAGVLMSAPADGEYCWVQIRGVATIAPALTAGADGNALTLVGAGDGSLDVSSAVTDFICAAAIDASARIIFCNFPR